MTGAELLVRSLEAEGVDYVFGLPGEELEDILFALEDSSIAFIPARHEQGAAFMADVYGRLTGDAGVMLGTLGPGATNLVTGIADAYLDRAPAVAITGQGGRARLHKESHQVIDVPAMFEPITQTTMQIADPEIIPEAVHRAFNVAEYEKPGPTHIEVPEDTAAASVEGAPVPTTRRRPLPHPPAGALDKAADLLNAAAAPVAFVGNGAARMNAAETLRGLIGRTNIPVVSTYMGKGVVSDRAPQSLMTLESGPNDEAATALGRADVVVAIGYDLVEHHPADWNPDCTPAIVHVDSTPAESDAHYTPTVELVGDIDATLAALDDRLDDAIGPAWLSTLRASIETHLATPPDPDASFSVTGTLPILRSAMADDDILISDVGSHKMAIAQQFPTHEPDTCLISNGLATMGIAVPGGIAASLVTDRNVVTAMGDGGFLMNAAEIETATRLGLDYTIVVFNDYDFGLISEKQKEHTGARFGTRLTNPEFTALAESFGITAYRPETWGELEAAVAEAVPADEMSLIEVRLLPDS